MDVGSTLALLAAEESDRSVLMPAVNELVWGTVAFVVFFVVMWKFAVPRANQALADRTANIEGKLETAEQDRAAAASLLAGYQQQMAEARAEAASIRDDARLQGEEIRAQLRADADAEARRRLEAAEAQIRAERDRVMAELRGEFGSISIELANRIVGEALASPQAQRDVIDRFLTEIESGGVTRRGASG